MKVRVSCQAKHSCENKTKVELVDGVLGIEQMALGEDFVKTDGEIYGLVSAKLLLPMAKSALPV